MTALKHFDLQEIADGLGVSLATVYRWRKGTTSPLARQVYEICALKWVRPATFAPFTGHAPLHPASQKPDAEAMGRWVRQRIQKVRDEAVTQSSVRSLARDATITTKTIKRCRDTDGVKWSVLLRFIEYGIGARAHDLLEGTPIPHIRGPFAESDPFPFSSIAEIPTRESNDDAAE
jgi:transcriptional regulator with XRE-family HTH domain